MAGEAFVAVVERVMTDARSRSAVHRESAAPVGLHLVVIGPNTSMRMSVRLKTRRPDCRRAADGGNQWGCGCCRWRGSVSIL